MGPSEFKNIANVGDAQGGWPVPQDLPVQKTLDFRFQGRAGEFFKIWIVNVLLTLLTLGIYSAWAKVRTRRYFYGNTRLDDAALAYLADPLQILEGRLIALGALVVYIVVTGLAPFMEPVFILVLLGAVPWLVTRAMAFNARNTAYRNVRLGFDATYGETLLVFVGLPLLSVLTLGLAYPYFDYRRRRFLMAQHRLGTTPFTFEPGVGAFYAIYLRAALLLVLLAGLMVAVTLLAGGSMVAMLAAGSPENLPPESMIYLMAMNLGLGSLAALGMLLVRAYVQANVTNLAWARTACGGHRFGSALSTGPLFWLYLSNMLGILLSLGLLIPWARIRMARYRVECLQLHTRGSLESFVATEQSRAGATGEELGDLLDIDLAV